MTRNATIIVGIAAAILLLPSCRGRLSPLAPHRAAIQEGLSPLLDCPANEIELVELAGTGGAGYWQFNGEATYQGDDGDTVAVKFFAQLAETKEKGKWVATGVMLKGAPYAWTGEK